MPAGNVKVRATFAAIPEAPQPVLPEDVTLNEYSVQLKAGETFDLTASVLPANADNKSVRWSSSDTQVATVSNGRITAVSAGTADIRVRTVAGDGYAMCAVTVEEGSLLVDALQPEGNTGSLNLSFNLPTQGTFTVSFVLTLPQGFGLNREATTLAAGLVADYQLSVTAQAGNSWLFGISPKNTRSLRAATTYRSLVNIVYTIEASVGAGTYEAQLSDVELKLSDNTLIREEAIKVSIVRSGTVGTLPVSPATYAYSADDVLIVGTPQAEQIAVYSLTGSLLYADRKIAGEAVFRIGHLPRGVLIVQGSSGWTQKIVR
jgi:hypothetical protein